MRSATILAAAASIALASSTAISTPYDPSEPKRKRGGKTVSRPLHEATQAKPKSDSLARMLGKKKRRS